MASSKVIRPLGGIRVVLVAITCFFSSGSNSYRLINDGLKGGMQDCLCFSYVFLVC